MEADQLKLLAKSIGPIDTVVADAGASGLKIYVEDVEAVGTVASILERERQAAKSGPKGPVVFTMMSGDLPGEVEIDTGNEYPVNPQLRGAIKHIDGVMAVEDY